MALPTCPSCGAKLFPHEITGGECTGCMTRLPDGFSADPLPAPDWRPSSHDVSKSARRWDEPRRIYDRPPASDYRLVRSGVNMVRWGIGLYLLVQVLGAAARFAGTAWAQGVGRDALVVVGVAAIGLAIAQIVLGLIVFIGICLCCTVPRESEGAGWARGLIGGMVLTVVLAITAVVFAVFAIANGAVELRRGPQNEMMVLFIIPLVLLGVVVLGTHLCFYMLLRGVARDFGDPALGGGFVAYFITSIVVPVVLVGGLFGLTLAAAGNGPGRGAMGDQFAVIGGFFCLLLVAAIALFIWQMTLFSRLYNLIPDASTERSYRDDGGRWD